MTRRSSKMIEENDGPGDYFMDVKAQEEELRKINEDIDLKLEKNVDHSTTINASLSKEDLISKDGHLINDAADSEFCDLLSIENITKDFVNKNHRSHFADDDESIAILSRSKKGTFIDRGTCSLKSIEGKAKAKCQSNTKLWVENKENCDTDPPNFEDDLDTLLDIDYFIEEKQVRKHHNNKQGGNAMQSTCCTPHDGKCIPTKTVNHLQKVRIQALTSQLKEAINGKSQLSKSNNDLKSKVTKLEETNRNLQSQVDRCQSNINKKMTKVKDTQIQLDDISSENASLKKEITNLRSILKESVSKSHANETKLKRAIESTEKFKAMITNVKSKQQDDTENFQKERKEYEAQIKDLAHQRDNVIIGFKKQMKLISLLKRQKVHLEASRLLDFTEKEFMGALDWKDVAEPT